MWNMFTLRTTSYNLRGNYIPTLPVQAKSTTYGLRLFLIANEPSRAKT